MPLRNALRYGNGNGNRASRFTREDNGNGSEVPIFHFQYSIFN